MAEDVALADPEPLAGWRNLRTPEEGLAWALERLDVGNSIVIHEFRACAVRWGLDCMCRPTLTGHMVVC